MFSTWLAAWKQGVDASSVVDTQAVVNYSSPMPRCSELWVRSLHKRPTGRKGTEHLFTSEALIACSLAGSNREAAWGCLIG